MSLPCLAVVGVLVCAAGAFAAEPASDASDGRGVPPSLDNTHCDAYRYATSSIRTPKDYGKVVLRVAVSAQGEVTGMEIVEHTTTNYFAHVVQESFSRCHYNPATVNGAAVAGHRLLNLEFGAHARTPNDAVCPTPFARELPPSTGTMVATRVRVRFSNAGRVASVDVLQSSGVPTLDDAAVKAYLQCHFDPAADGQPAFQEEWVTTVNWSS